MMKFLKYYWENTWFFVAFSAAVSIAAWLTLGVKEHKPDQLLAVLGLIWGANLLTLIGNIIPYRKANGR